MIRVTNNNILSLTNFLPSVINNKTHESTNDKTPGFSLENDPMNVHLEYVSIMDGTCRVVPY